MAAREQDDHRHDLRWVGRLPAAHPIIASLAFVVVVSAFFLAFPGVDLWVSGLFYHNPEGFFLHRNNALQLFRGTGQIAVILIVAWLVVQLGVKLAKPERPSYVRPKVTLFLLSTLLVGPLLLVNLILKDHWGRPRPNAVDIFGGGAPYVEVWRITNYCNTNCSFVSGETSTAFWLMALALVVPRALRAPVAIVTGLYAVLLSLNRIAFGGHFLSDVLISAGLTLLVVAIGYRLFITHPARRLENEQLEADLTRLGRALGRRERSKEEQR